MKREPGRRKFLKALFSVPAVLAASGLAIESPRAQTRVDRAGGPKLKIGLNAYSFNENLMNGEMTLDELLEFCAHLGIEAVDLTGYYFPNYPAVPPNEYIYHIKRKAFLLGLDISGTGVRNDFTVSDPVKRNADIKLVKEWIKCASGLGAPLVRVFAGNMKPEGDAWMQMAERVAQDFRECAEFGAQHGVIVAMQNHNDFVRTADQVLQLLQMVDSEWFGLLLDIGSLRTGDPYEEIARLAPYAISWQIKELVYEKGEAKKTDTNRIIQIIREVGFRGYLPLETLGEGDARKKVERLYKSFRAAIG